MPDHTATDADAIRSITELYRSQRAALVRLIRPVVDTVEIAEEIVHDVFVRLLCARTVPTENPVAYLRSAAMNAARSELRRRAVSRRHQPAIASEQLVRAETLVGDAVCDRIDAGRIDRHLEALAPRQRDVITLRYVHELREHEIAERLGITPGSVKVHASRGMRRLRSSVLAEQVLAEQVVA